MIRVPRAPVVALLAAAFAVGLPAGGPPRLFADVPTSVSGTVTDTHGVAIEAAQVTLTSLRGGSARVHTDADGAFRFPSQAAFTSYALSVEADGYRTVTYEGFRLEPSRARRFDIRLKRPGDRDVLVLVSRDPYPFEDLMRG